MTNVRPFEFIASFIAGARIPTGAGAGKIAVSDASGNIEWKTLLYIERAAYIIDGAVVVKKWEPFFVEKATSDTACSLLRVRSKLGAGTSAKVTVKQNGTNVTGFTSLSVTKTKTAEEPTAVTLAEGDELLPEVTEIAAAPENMTFQFVIAHTI